MLVLTRKVKEGVVVSGNIHLQVLAIKRGRVKIGISTRESSTGHDPDRSRTGVQWARKR